MIDQPKIHEDGIYFGMPMNEYLDDPALGSSDIKNLIISPLTYWANSHMNPDREPREETEATTFGNIIHEAVFEPEKNKLIAKPDGMSFARKDGKAWREQARAEGFTIITGKEQRALNMILKAVERSGIARRVLGAAPEVSYFWTDNGHRCKIRLDAMLPTEGFDLKTFANQMSKDLETCIAHAVSTYRYHISGFWYSMGIQHMRTMIEKGKVKTFNRPNTFDMEMMSRIPAGEHFPYWYLFVEKGAVPNVVVREFVPKTMGDPNAYWLNARRAVADATASYAKMLDRFGEDEMWMTETHWKPFDDVEFGAARWILDE